MISEKGSVRSDECLSLCRQRTKRLNISQLVILNYFHFRAIYRNVHRIHEHTANAYTHKTQPRTQNKPIYTQTHTTQRPCITNQCLSNRPTR